MNAEAIQLVFAHVEAGLTCRGLSGIELNFVLLFMV